MPSIKIDFDFHAMEQALDRLSDPENIRHLAHAVALAGGFVLRDEARIRAPVKSGKLKSSIYVANVETVGPLGTYRVSWNSKKAPHGHLIEFGHWMVKGKGVFAIRGAWVPAQPFLRPAYDASKVEIGKAMNKRANEKIQELIHKND